MFRFLSRSSLSRNRPGVLGSGPVSRLLPSTNRKSESALPRSLGAIRALFYLFLGCERFHEFIGFARGNVFGDSVTLLQAADQLFPSSSDDVQVVVGQFAPLFTDLAFVLLPFS